MNREDAREYILAHATEYLERDKSGRGFVCPICGSGSGKKGTGITTKDGGKHFTCWSGCFSSSDIIDIIGLKYGLTDYNDKLKNAAAEFGIEIESWYVNLNKSDHQKDFGLPDLERHDPQQEEQKTDFTPFYLQAHKDIDQTDYWKKRGLSRGTVDRFMLGYCEAWRNPKTANAPATPRLIIPITKYSYLARDVREEVPEHQEAYKKSKAKGEERPSWLFNHKALQAATQPIYVVEGEIDAMSIIEAGGEAVAIGSLAFVSSFVSALKEKRPTQPLIICMDNEKEQSKREKCEAAAKDIEKGCQTLGIVCKIANVAGDHKDANDALVKDYSAFRERVKRLADFSAIDEQVAESIENESAAHALKGFLERIEKNRKAPFYSTGFTAVDEVLDGGLYAGLYVVGAISSLGKTTFCLQVADHAAQRGNDVLIFSLEMSKDELMAKSISRETCLADLEIHDTTEHAKSTRGVLLGAWNHSAIEQTIAVKALQRYEKYARHLYITEGMGNIGVEQIREKVQEYVKAKGKAPIVLIDYLQILAPADPRATDKQNTDKAILELKRLSRDFGIPVIGISSFNRDNYTAPVNLASFKESGAIEYSSDVLIGLQYDGMDWESGETEKARNTRIRDLLADMTRRGKEGKSLKIQLKVLKNRNGSKGDCYLEFYPMFNYFKDAVLTFSDAEDDMLPEEWADC